MTLASAITNVRIPRNGQLEPAVILIDSEGRIAGLEPPAEASWAAARTP